MATHSSYLAWEIPWTEEPGRLQFLFFGFVSFGVIFFVVAFLFSCQVMPDSLQTHGRQHGRISCLSLSPGICSNSGSLNR